MKGKVALVTGAARGIGVAIADAFEREGANVVRLDRSEPPRPSGGEGVGGEGGASVLAFDLAGPESKQDLMDRIEREYGPLEILVNCAAICPTRPMMDADEATWRAVFDVNVHAPFFLLQAAARRMIPRGHGVIINLASVSAFLPKLEQVDYGASKAALVSITRSAAAALGPHGIRVNAIAPGVIDTPLTQSIAQQRGDIRGVAPEETLRPVLAATPLGRMGTPEEVADLAVFLASDRASYITGQTIGVDGGFLMR